MEVPSSPQAMLQQIRKSLEDKSFDEVENLWMEIAEQPTLAPETIAGLVGAASQLVEAGEGERAGALLELVLPLVSEVEPGSDREALRYFEILARLFPTSDEYRAMLVDHFESTHGPTSAERAFFESSGIKESGNSAEALDRFERLSKFHKGACVYHEAGWGVGEVLAVDPFLKQVRVDLEKKKDHRIAIGVVDSILQPLPKDGIRALLYRGQGDELRELARENPVLLIDKVLAAFGNPLPLKEIRSELVPAIIEEGGWTRWWSGVKRQLRSSGFYRVRDRAPYTVEKLESELKYEDDLLVRFQQGDWSEKRKVARIVLRTGAKKFPLAFPAVRDDLKAVVERSEDPAAVLESALWLYRYDPEEEDHEVLRSILSTMPVEAVCCALERSSSAEDIRTVLRVVWDSDPGRALDWLLTAFRIGSDSVRQAAADVLSDREETALARAAEEITRSPRVGPGAFCWIVEQKLSGKRSAATAYLEERSQGAILVLLLDLLEHLVDRSARGENQADVREALRRLENLLYYERGAFFQKAVEEFSPEARRETHRQLVRCAGHLPRLGTRLLELIVIVEPQIMEDEAKSAWWDVDAIFVTQEGLARRREEFREIMDVKIPQNFEAVGKAADFGDLSENAEFTSALEEQGMLTERAARMKEELDKARVLGPEDVRRDVTGPGSRVRVLDQDTEEELTYSILGPWDGTVEEGVLNYLSPLGGIFLGRRPGEEFVAELPGGKKRYRLEEISSHFERSGSLGAR